MARKKKKLSEMMDRTVVYGDKFGDIGGSAGDRIKRGGSGLALKAAPKGDPFGAIGNLSPGTRIERGRTGKITEDDPRWDPSTMGNRRRGKRRR
jgi:hypothetical protein